MCIYICLCLNMWICVLCINEYIYININMYVSVVNKNIRHCFTRSQAEFIFIQKIFDEENCISLFHFDKAFISKKLVVGTF